MHKVVPKNAILIPDSAKRVFDGVIYDVYQWEQQNFDDSTTTFEMLKRPDTALAICIVDDKILVLDNEQPHRGSRVCFPGGRVDDTDESTLAAAKREVKEETGYEFAQWRLASVVQPQPKLEWFIYLYIAFDVTHQGDINPDAGERIKTELKTLEEIKRMAEESVGFIGEGRHFLKNLTDTDALKTLPEFQGQTVDR